MIKKYNQSRGRINKESLCYASFSSLLFIQSGHVMPCHYNRGKVLGKIPEQSIHDIWFGEEIKKLRNFIKNNDLSYGCESCYYNIYNNQFFNAGCKKYDNLHHPGKYPVMMDFQLKNTCNLECIMCSGEYSSSIRKNREKKEAYPDFYNDNFVSQLDEFIPHLKFAKFTGGEPFLIQTYYNIWEKIITQNDKISISVSTNGSILNKKIKAVLEKLAFNFTISIDSISEENYPKIRKNSELKNVLENISYFHDYSLRNKTSMIIKFVVIQQNRLEIPDFFEYWNNKNIRLLPKIVWYPPTTSLRDISVQELQKTIDLFKNKRLSGKTKIQRLNINYYKGMINQLENWLIDKNNATSGNMTSDEIQKAILNNIKTYLETKSFIKEQEIKERINYYKNTLYFLSNCYEDEENKKNAFHKFEELPVHIIVAEMDRENPDKLAEKFKQSCYF